VSVGIANQRETTILWDRQTGEPIHNAIVWQDRRTAEFCSNLKAEGGEKIIREKTGLVIDPYFSGTKIAWLLDNIPGARLRAERGELAFAPWIPGSSGSSRETARTSPILRTPRAPCCSTSRAATGTRS